MEIRLVLEIYDLFEFILDHSTRIYVGQIEPTPHGRNKSSICYAALHKGLLGLYNAIDCTIDGRVGFAYLSLRQVVEYLIIAKAAVFDDSDTILCDWIEEKEINLQRKIYNYIRVNKSDVKGLAQMKDFYNVLGKFVHSTRVSQQVSFSHDMVKEQVKGAFPLILTILNMYRHLLFSIYMQNLGYAMSRYLPSYVKKSERLKILLDKTFTILPAASRRVISFYKKKWILKLPPLDEQRRESLVEYEKVLKEAEREHTQENKLIRRG